MSRSLNMVAKEPDDFGVEVTVKGRYVEARRIAAKARQVRREPRRARWQKGKLSSRHGVNVRLARQAIGHARRAVWTDARTPQFGSPELERNLDRGQILFRENDARRIDRGHDKAGVGQRFCRVVVTAEPAAAIVRDDHQRQLAPRDRTVLRALKGIGPVHRKVAERYALRR